MGVSWALNMLTWHCIDEERDDESFIGVEEFHRVETLLHYFQNMSVLETGP